MIIMKIGLYGSCISITFKKILGLDFNYVMLT